MIYYQSTKGKDNKRYKFSESLLTGMASDGGLLVPEKIPEIALNEIGKLMGRSYQQVASKIFEKFETDFSKTTLKKVIKNSYGKNFDNLEIAPIVKLREKQYLIELWHGPTAAFKDMALQIMPKLFLEALKKLKKNEKYLVLAATSGDTGSAALNGFKDLKNLSVFVLYPLGRVAKIQELQMVTQEGKNLEVISIKSDFDKTQQIVKEILGNQKYKQLLIEKFNTNLTSANSINWGRLIPQIIYYFTSYLKLIENKEVKLGEKIDIAVPTGNFGNILAGFLAKKMGLPINKLICASNENNAVALFLQNGTYDIKNKKMKQTSSPAMDILVANNIERLLFLVTRDADKVADWMNQLKVERRFAVDSQTLKLIKEYFYSGFVSNKQSLSTIKSNYLENKYLFDPHTSVAATVAKEFINESKSKNTMLICSTAHWVKFPDSICKALGIKSSNDEFQTLKLISDLKYVIPVPKSISSLTNKKRRFNKSSSPSLELIQGLIEEFMNVKT